MKLKALAITGVLATALTGCAAPTGTTTATAPAGTTAQPTTLAGIGASIVQTAVKQKCQSELQTNQYWNLARLAMTPDAQARVADNVCGCVAEKAPQTVSMNEVATAVIDPTARAQVATKAVVGSIQACMTSFFTPVAQTPVANPVK